MGKRHVIKKLTKKGLVDLVLAQINSDVKKGEFESLEVMLENCPSNILIEYLPEDLDENKAKEMLEIFN